MNYDFNQIEAKWQKYWEENQTFKASNSSGKPKYYVLDMFPYPSGAGLHVGHPLGYIASDIYARYKRHQGFNVLHPQGYDSFGLPAEQYAIQTGQHPATTTKANIARYREQLDKIGFSFDWNREVQTSNPEYYKWTQWIFGELFNSWYNLTTDKAERINTLISEFEKNGNINIKAVCDEGIKLFSAEDWNAFSNKEQQEILLQYRLTFLAETEVNWCPQLGTVLANDEIINGVSERGGYPVVRKKMTQWSMRISAYANRLIEGLDQLDWSESIKETQRNWIGKSVGASVYFNVLPITDAMNPTTIEVFTTRPDTIYGVTYMALAPEHPLVIQLTTAARKDKVEAYVEATAKRSERERMADVKTISGVFTGSYAEHPVTKRKVPIWIADYVLASYGTGAVMAVPCGDQRDFDFATHFNIPIEKIFKGVDISKEAYTDKTNAVITNSDFLNDLSAKEAAKLMVKTLEDLGCGQGKVNYRLRDAVFSRQRYWGEPFPIYYVDGMPQLIDTKHLPINLPEVEKYLPTEDGAPPLGRAKTWAWDTETNSVVDNDKINNTTIHPLELNTMPGWAGSSWYLFRYMDNTNTEEFASKEALDYWQNVDLYVGGSEHGTGHLLYSRFWTKFLHDRGFLSVDEPFKKMINQGMIQGVIEFALRNRHSSSSITVNKKYVEIYNEKEELGDVILSVDCENIIVDLTNEIDAIPVPIEYVSDYNNSERESFLDEKGVYKFCEWQKLKNPVFVSNKGYFKVKDSTYYDFEGNVLDSTEFRFFTKSEVGKMSKSKYNVVNPDDICVEYGADTLRLYEMFLGPLEQAKPWNTAGITGVHNFLKKMWKLYVGEDGAKFNTTAPTKDNLKTLHKTIKKVVADIENFSFNTSVSTFMICVNELTAQKCTSKSIFSDLAVLISPYAPHIAEELWNILGNATSVSTVAFPVFEEKHLIESTKEYPVSFNGKMRFKLELPLDMSKDEIEKTVMAYEKTQRQLDGRIPKKVIVVPGKIINIVG